MHNFYDALPSIPVVGLQRGIGLWGDNAAFCQITLTSCYTTRGSHVFVCFAGFSKAFDRVNYWKLFRPMIDMEIPTSIVSLLAFWYSQQVQWHIVKHHLSSQLVMEQNRVGCYYCLVCLILMYSV